MKKHAYIFVMLAIAAASCKVMQPVERVVVDVRRDTIALRDSVYISRVQYVRGDTIYVRDTVATTRWRDNVKVVQRTDSVPYIVEVVKEVRKRNWYDKTTSAGFWVLLVAVLAAVAIRILMRIYMRK